MTEKTRRFEVTVQGVEGGPIEDAEWYLEAGIENVSGVEFEIKELEG